MKQCGFVGLFDKVFKILRDVKPGIHSNSIPEPCKFLKTCCFSQFGDRKISRRTGKGNVIKSHEKYRCYLGGRGVLGIH